MAKIINFLKRKGEEQYNAFIARRSKPHVQMSNSTYINKVYTSKKKIAK